MATLNYPKYDYSTDDPYSPYYNPQQDYSYPENPTGGYYDPNAPGPQFEPATQGTGSSETGYSYDWAQPWPQSTQPAFSAPTSQPRSSSAYSLGTPTTTTTGISTPIRPGIPMPALTLPAWDEGAIKSARRKYMAPVRRVQEGLRRTLASLPSADNPYVAKEMGRGAVEAYGTSVSDISMRAGMMGQQEYERRRAEEVTALTANFQAAMQDYMAQYGRKTTTTQKTTYGQQTAGQKLSYSDWLKENPGRTRAEYNQYRYGLG